MHLQRTLDPLAHPATNPPPSTKPLEMPTLYIPVFDKLCGKRRRAKIGKVFSSMEKDAKKQYAQHMQIFILQQR